MTDQGRAAVLLSMSTRDAARLISSPDMSFEDAAGAFLLMPPGKAASILEQIDLSKAGRILDVMTPQEAASVLSEMDATRGGDILGLMEPSHAASTLISLPQEKVVEILGSMDPSSFYF